MGLIGRVLNRLSPSSLLRLYMAIVMVAAAVSVTVVLLSSSKIDELSGRSADEAKAALTAADIRITIGAQIGTFSTQRGQFVLTPAFASLSPEQKTAVLREMSRDFVTDGAATEPDLPVILVPLSQKDAAEVQSETDQTLRAVNEVLSRSRNVDQTALTAARDEYKNTLGAFYDTPTLGLQRLVMFRSRALLSELSAASNAAAAAFAENRADLSAATSFARTSMILALVLLTATMGIATFAVSRLIQRAFAVTEEEKETLRSTTGTLQYRNTQLSALYNVFSEITDTLSLPYVVAATLREALRLMPAHVASLRLLKDGMLVLAGSLTDDGSEWQAPQEIALGEGPIGRTAKRGRTLRTDDTNESLLTGRMREAGVRSALIVPLIVGARVVGILACWSSERNAFSEEDERILEMMASQVATAVAAADMTETSERRAHHDPLTGLPNRLQLTQDLDGALAGMARRGRRAVVAMVDIDHFKHLNDEYGHRVGDVTLQKVASLLRNSVRDQDRVYRYGGEEFVMIFVDADAEEATALADRVRSNVASTPLSGDRLEPVGPVTISIGLAALPDHSEDLNHLIDLADAAMYRAKEAGRNRVVLWTDGEQERATLSDLVA